MSLALLRGPTHAPRVRHNEDQDAPEPTAIALECLRVALASVQVSLARLHVPQECYSAAAVSQVVHAQAQDEVQRHGFCGGGCEENGTATGAGDTNEASWGTARSCGGAFGAPNSAGNVAIGPE